MPVRNLPPLPIPPDAPTKDSERPITDWYRFFVRLMATLGDLVARANSTTPFAGTPAYADDAAAAAGGVPIGGVYRTGSVLKVRVA